MPLALTVSEWQLEQVAAVTGAVRAWWPVGGIPWQPVQASVGVAFQAGVAVVLPETPPKSNLPWQ